MSSSDQKHLANMTYPYAGYYNYYYDPQGYAQQYAAVDPSAYPQSQAAYTQNQAPVSPVASWFNYKDSSYLKGFLVGAGVALVLANPTVQKALISGTVKCWNALQGGVEEVKEKVKDVRAEMSNDD